MLFTGTYEHTIDAKNRLAVPVEIRQRLLVEWSNIPSVMRPAEHAGLYVLLGHGSLNLYTDKGFEKRAEELDQSELATEQLLEYERFMFSLAERADMDQVGRIRLPENLLKMSGLGKDVVLLGVKDHLEIRDRASWQEQVKQMLASHPEMLKNPRELMKRNG